MITGFWKLICYFLKHLMLNHLSTAETKITASRSQGLSSASVSVILIKGMYSDLFPTQQHP